MNPNQLLLGILWISLLILIVSATGTKPSKKCKDFNGKRDKCIKHKAYFKGRKGHCIYEDGKCRDPKNNCELYRPKKKDYGCEEKTCITTIGKGRVTSKPSKKFEKCINDDFKNRCIANKSTGACDCHCHRERKIHKLPKGFTLKHKNKKEVDVGTCAGSCPHYRKSSCKPIYECKTIVKRVRIKASKGHKKTSKNHKKVHDKLIWKDIELSIRVIKKCDCFKTYNDKISKCNDCGKPCESSYICGKYTKGSRFVNKYCKFSVFYKNEFQKKYGCAPGSCSEKCALDFKRCYGGKKDRFDKCYHKYLSCKKECKCIDSCDKHDHKDKCIKYCKEGETCYKKKVDIFGKCMADKKCKDKVFTKGVECYEKCKDAEKNHKKQCCKKCKYLPKSHQKECYRFCEPKIEKCVRKSHCGKKYESCVKTCDSSFKGRDCDHCKKRCAEEKKRCPHECCIDECSHLSGFLKRLWKKKCYVIAGPHSEKCTHCLKAKKKCLDKLKYIKAAAHVIEKLKKKCHQDYFKCNVKCRCKHTCKNKKGNHLKSCLKTCFNKHKPPKKNDKKKDDKKKDDKKKKE